MDTQAMNLHVLSNWELWDVYEAAVAVWARAEGKAAQDAAKAKVAVIETEMNKR